MHENKPQGFDVIDLRIGGQRQRLCTARLGCWHTQMGSSIGSRSWRGLSLIVTVRKMPAVRRHGRSSGTRSRRQT